MIKCGIVMDPIQHIHFEKDSTLAMLLAAKKRGWQLYYFEQNDLFFWNDQSYGNSKILNVFDDSNHWYEFGRAERIALAECDVILMRKDPPFNQEYIYTTYLLEHAEAEGVLVVNKPQSLRDANEKLFTIEFPECCPPTVVTRSKDLLREFLKEYKDIVCKPLDAMGGYAVFHLTANDLNASVVFETLTERESRFIVAQKYIPEITAGDKRILLINGIPIPYALARVPGKGDWRGNLAAGAKGVAQPLTERDFWIAEQVGPYLREKGLIFVGLDVIGDYLTEINVTSPTCIRELEKQCELDISDQLMDNIEQLLNQPHNK